MAETTASKKGEGGYCGYIDGFCECRGNTHACLKIPPVACRNRAMRIKKEKEDGKV